MSNMVSYSFALKALTGVFKSNSINTPFLGWKKLSAYLLFVSGAVDVKPLLFNTSFFIVSISSLQFWSPLKNLPEVGSDLFIACFKQLTTWFDFIDNGSDFRK